MKHIFSLGQLAGLILILVASFMFSLAFGILALGIELFVLSYTMEKEGTSV